MKFITSEWLKAAFEDIQLMKAISGKQELTGVSAFHAQQAVEKCFKAIFEEKGMVVPKIHDLIRLYRQLDNHIILNEDQINLLMVINELYIDSRYPADLGLLPNGRPSVDEAREFLSFAEGIYESVVELVR
mgnify:CR=1 FL=1